MSQQQKQPSDAHLAAPDSTVASRSSDDASLSVAGAVSTELERPAVVCDEHLDFLDDLRESGVTNMFGAGPYLRDEFPLTKSESHAVLSYWMKTFASRHGINES
jgi:hypothetical protein